LVLGSGLSALDVLAFLDARGFEGRATVLSPRGLLPLAHAAPGGAPLPPLDTSTAPRTLAALVRWVRRAIAGAVDGGATWQAAVDALRPGVARLYRSLSPRDRARFVRHVRPYWDIFRHRAPQESLARLKDWQDAERLTRVAGRARVVAKAGARLRVEIAERRGGRAREERFDAVVRCVGPALLAADGENPLVRSLVEQGLARRSSSGLGIDTDPEGRLLDGAGRAQERLIAIGAARRASDWETTSAPDIAVHARAIARSLRLRARREVGT
jgi:uncharacterized NAD(P)/FAD-binding protein YdhS